MGCCGEHSYTSCATQKHMRSQHRHRRHVSPPPTLTTPPMPPCFTAATTAGAPGGRSPRRCRRRRGNHHAHRRGARRRGSVGCSRGAAGGWGDPRAAGRWRDTAARRRALWTARSSGVAARERGGCALGHNAGVGAAGRRQLQREWMLFALLISAGWQRTCNRSSCMLDVAPWSILSHALFLLAPPAAPAIAAVAAAAAALLLLLLHSCLFTGAGAWLRWLHWLHWLHLLRRWRRRLLHWLHC